MVEYVEKENLLALAWRLRMGLSRPELAKLTGWSISSIRNIEDGIHPATGAQIKPNMMKRYKLSCAAVQLGIRFDWKTLTLAPRLEKAEPRKPRKKPSRRAELGQALSAHG